MNVQLTNYWGNGGTEFWVEGVQGKGSGKGEKQIGTTSVFLELMAYFASAGLLKK